MSETFELPPDELTALKNSGIFEGVVKADERTVTFAVWECGKFEHYEYVRFGNNRYSLSGYQTPSAEYIARMKAAGVQDLVELRPDGKHLVFKITGGLGTLPQCLELLKKNIKKRNKKYHLKIVNSQS